MNRLKPLSRMNRRRRILSMLAVPIALLLAALTIPPVALFPLSQSTQGIITSTQGNILRGNRGILFLKVSNISALPLDISSLSIVKSRGSLITQRGWGVIKNGSLSKPLSRARFAAGKTYTLWVRVGVRSSCGYYLPETETVDNIYAVKVVTHRWILPLTQQIKLSTPTWLLPMKCKNEKDQSFSPNV